jgi:hypothetical protein
MTFADDDLGSELVTDILGKGATTIQKWSTPKWVEAPSPSFDGEDIV